MDNDEISSNKGRLERFGDWLYELPPFVVLTIGLFVVVLLAIGVFYVSGYPVFGDESSPTVVETPVKRPASESGYHPFATRPPG